MTLVKITTISHLVTTNKMSRWIVQPNKNCTSRLYFKRRMAISHERLIYYFIVAKTIIPLYTTFSTKPVKYHI